MYNKIQLDVIKAFGSKELSEGCLLQNNFSDKHEPYTFRRKVGNKYITFSKQFNREMEFNMSNGMTFESTFTILGHIPELFPDVARVAKENGYEMTVSSDWGISIRTHEDDERESIPFNPTLPLIDQDEQLTLLPLINIFNHS